MTKYLITGASGFVGRHLLFFLDSQRISTEILALDYNPDPTFRPKNISYRFESIDLENRKALENAVEQFRPDRVVHLAARSSVQESWSEPGSCVSSNTATLINLLDGVRKADNPCRVLFVGSSEVYAPQNAALHETMPLNPRNPYALSRLLQEEICRFYVENFGLNIVSTRSFLHIGPRQQRRFAIASFVGQLVDAKNQKNKQAVLKTGNVDLQRDISDVRDVVRAYFLLLENGRNGEIYNICRGKSVFLREIIEIIADILNLDVRIEVDKNLLRNVDASMILGNNEKVRAETGWTVERTLEQTLRDMIDSATNQT